jgi:hypothetical protein
VVAGVHWACQLNDGDFPRQPSTMLVAVGLGEGEGEAKCRGWGCVIDNYGKESFTPASFLDSPFGFWGSQDR